VIDHANILNPLIGDYLESVAGPVDPLLEEMARHGKERDFPYLGALCARILHMLVRTSNARRVFELGSGYGYTMYWMAKALPHDGLVIGTEFEQSNIDIANEYFKRGGLTVKTDLRRGEALEIFAGEPGPFDLIFNDINKDQYPRVIEMAKPRLRRHGLLVSDNVLASARVVDASANDPQTAAIREYNERLASDPDFITTIIPIRDGLSVALKIAD
jgi:predicted O-methyltransferase YrrM